MADFRAALVAKGNTAKHVEMTDARVKFVISKSGATHVADLTPSAVLQVIKGIHDAGRSLETVNSYLRAIKGFTRWLWRDKRTVDDPLATLEGYNTSTESQRHARRELTLEELDLSARACRAVHDGCTQAAWTRSRHVVSRGTRHGISGQRAAVAHARLVRPGQRPANHHGGGRLQQTPPEGRATYSARLGRPAETLVGADGQPTDECFGRCPATWLGRSARTWTQLAPHGSMRRRQTRRNRNAARNPSFCKYEDADGRIADFHALRHTYISGVVASGASVKTAQTLARHSDPG